MTHTSARRDGPPSSVHLVSSQTLRYIITSDGAGRERQSETSIILPMPYVSLFPKVWNQ